MDRGSRARKGLSLATIAAIYLFLYLPLVVLFIFSFNIERFPAPWSGFTLKWYRELFESVYLWKAFGTSLVVATSATCISLAAGIGLIFYASHGGKVRRYMSLFYANLVIPETILAVSLLAFFTAIGIPLGMTTLILAHSVLGLGFVIPITYARYQSLDGTLVEASFTLGASSVETFFKIILPMLRPSLISSALLVFILSFDDFILSYFCAGSTAQTLSLYIIGMIRTGVSPVVNALSSVLLVLSSLLALIFFSLKSRARLL